MIQADSTSSLTTDVLARKIHDTDSAAYLVLPRVLRRIIRLDRQISGIGAVVPHRKSYLLPRDRLRQLASADELGLENFQQLRSDNDPVLLLVQPDPGKITRRSVEQTLLKYWRLLFHIQVHRALEWNWNDDRVSTSTVKRWIHQIGQTEFDEIRAVLRQERFLLPPRDDRSVLIEFGAVYLELRHFAPTLLPRYFPTLADESRIDRFWATHLDVPSLIDRSRLAGAPAPIPISTTMFLGSAGETDPHPQEPVARTSHGGDTENFSMDESTIHALQPSLWKRLLGRLSSDSSAGERYRLLTVDADRRVARGNDVRAAIIRLKAKAFVTETQQGQAEAAARRPLNHLVDRLAAALDLNEEQVREWRAYLPAALKLAIGSYWSTAARFLYDLQKACIDFERDAQTIDLFGWLFSLGRRPIRRSLPSQREIRIVQHLHRAKSRLPKLRLATHDRTALNRLISDAIHQAEQQLRDRFRPIIAGAIAIVGLRPRHVVETVALEKLVEELTDLLVDRGFLSLGDLRDAISRNNLKLHDLSGPREFIRGDLLLLADRELAMALDGIYRRGEVYLRWLQSLSSLGFGTRMGRWLHLYLLLPFGISYVVLGGLHHLFEAFHVETHLQDWPAVIAGAILTGAMLHRPTLRQHVKRILALGVQAVRILLIDLPTTLLSWPPIKSFLAHPLARMAWRFVLKPLVVSALIWNYLPLEHQSVRSERVNMSALFLTVNVLLNSRVGRDSEEIVVDWLHRQWHYVKSNLLPGLFRVIMAFFKRLVEAVDRFLYGVDEWLRFRQGDHGFNVASKAILGMAWFLVAYVIRFYMIVLIEPQVNPIKHFPVVTVAAKILLPFTVPLTKLFAEPLKALGAGTVFANTFAGLNVFILPGLFGFLVWELRENWRLYEANRPESLQPSIIGNHGETMLQFLTPGFHSGTVPKLYARLRKAARVGYRTGDWRGVHRQLSSLDHVIESLHHAIDREMLSLLRKTQADVLSLTICDISVSSNRIRISLAPDSQRNQQSHDNSSRTEHSATLVCLIPALVMHIEEQSGLLVAVVEDRGWRHQLTRHDRDIIDAAVVGFFKIAGIDIVRPMVERTLGDAVIYDINDKGISVWSIDERMAEGIYHLENDWEKKDTLLPVTTDETFAATLPPLVPKRDLFRAITVPWDEWVSWWDAVRSTSPEITPSWSGIPIYTQPTLHEASTSMRESTVMADAKLLEKGGRDGSSVVALEPAGLKGAFERLVVEPPTGNSETLLAEQSSSG